MSEVAQMTDKEYIAQAVQKYDVTDAAIAELKERYSNLSIADVNDKEGYKVVHTAIAEIRTLRVSVEKKRVELKQIALEYGRAVDSKAKEITAKLEEIENPLKSEKERIDTEKERIKLEKQREEEEKFNGRVNRLFEVGLRFNGTFYELGSVKVGPAMVREMTDEDFDSVIAKANEEHQIVLKAQEEAEQARLAEQARMEEERQKQEVERRRLAEEKAELDRQMAEIQRQKAELEAEREREEARKRAEIEAEEARKKAEIEAKETEKRAKKEAEERAKREEMLRPDKEKLHRFADETLQKIVVPTCTDPMAQAISNKMTETIGKMIHYIHENTAKL